MAATIIGKSFMSALLVVSAVSALDNGLALTPPMGWLSWERYRCETDCNTYPDRCISEKLYMTMADYLVSEGYRDVGYKYVNIDNCWATKNRDKNGTLVADPVRFPSGIKALADYMHSKGLKLGIYGDLGTFTCGNFSPGSVFHMEKDANTFAAWGIDMLKFDVCNTNIDDVQNGFPAMALYLNQTGRPILFSCEWPLYMTFIGKTPNYTAVAESCNIWRNTADMDDDWNNVKNTLKYYAEDKGNFSKVARPGAFNDPDMLIIGDFGLSHAQERVQMALWAILAAPLFMSNDLRNMPQQSKELLQNKRILAINQDKLGIAGTRIAVKGSIEYWMRPLAPKGKSFAFAVLYLANGGDYVKLSVPFKDLGADLPGGYNVTEVFSGENVGTFKPQDQFTLSVSPSGVYLGEATINEP